MKKTVIILAILALLSVILISTCFFAQDNEEIHTYAESRMNEENNFKKSANYQVAELPNEEYVTERIVEEEVLVSEKYILSWEPLSIQATTTTADIEIFKTTDEEITEIEKPVLEIKVEKISETVNLMDLVLVLDCSNSMQSLMNDLKTAANGVVDHVFSTSTDSTISLITYGDTAKNHGTFEVGNKKTLKDTINALAISGNTNIYQALDKTNEEILAVSNGRKRVVLFLSDGAPTFYDNDKNMPEVQIIKESGCTNVPLSWNKQHFPTNTRQNILSEIAKLKSKQNVSIYSVGLGVDDLSETKIQYVEKEDSSQEQSVYKEEQYKIVNGVKYLYMTEKEYATYVLNSISSLGKYIETDNLNSTFEEIIIEQKKTSEIIKLNPEETVANIPETKEIIGEVTVTIGTNSTPYSLDELEKGVNGLVYMQGSGFEWTIANNNALPENKLGLSYKVKGAKGD